MRIQYSEDDPERVTASAVGKVVMISKGAEIDGFTSPDDARVFAAELIAAADAADAHVMTEMDLRDEAERGDCSLCCGPLNVKAWNWCSECVDKRLRDNDARARRARRR